MLPEQEPDHGMLTGTRVLDLTQGIAGPACTRILAGYGADVVKVERPGGDITRRFDNDGLPSDGRESELFAYLNGGKRGIVLDLCTPQGQADLDRLIAGADVVVENYEAGVAERLRVTRARIAGTNPAAVFVSVPSVPKGSPYTDYRACHLILMALSGYLYHNGYPDRQPLLLGQDAGLHLAGLMAALYAVAALHLRNTTGNGVAVEIPITHAINWCQFSPLADIAMLGAPLWPRKDSGPPGIVRCLDGYVGTGMIASQQWADMMSFLGRSDFAQRQDWLRDPNLRKDHADEWGPPLVEWMRVRTAAEVMEVARMLRLPYARVESIPDLLGIEHHRRRGFFVPQEMAGGPVDVPGQPFQLAGTEWRTPGRAPRLGEQGLTAVPDWEPRPAPVPPSPGRTYPLQGLRVLELGAWWSAASCCTTLGALGAEVIRIESPRMDAWRLTKARFDRDPPWEWGPVFCTFNLNKQGMTLDLADPRGKEIFLRLVEQADVVVDNFSARVMPNLGLTYDVLRQRNPALIMASISGYGSTGPLRDSAAMGSVFEQASGLASVTGYEDDRPCDLNSYSDAMVGQWAATAVLGAIERRRRTGLGGWIDLAAVQCLSTFLGPAIASYQTRGVVPRRLGDRHAGAAPHNLYRCAGEDEWVAFVVLEDAQWPLLVRALGDLPWAADPALCTLAGRKANEDAIDIEIGRWTASRDHYEVMQLLQKAGVPAAAVLAAEEQEQDPSLRDSDLFGVLDRAISGPAPYPHAPARFDGRVLEFLGPAPLFDEHTRAVLGRLAGLSDSEIDELYAAGICARTPAGYE